MGCPGLPSISGGIADNLSPSGGATFQTLIAAKGVPFWASLTSLLQMPLLYPKSGQPSAAIS